VKYLLIAVLALAGCGHKDPVSIIGIAGCEGIKGVIFVDENGVLYPKLLEDLDVQKLQALANSLPKGHLSTATVCEGVGT
jgi:hypothetical protein